MAGALSEALATQPFELHRATFLAKRLLAMETFCRVFCRGTFSLQEEAQRCFDIRPTWNYPCILALKRCTLNANKMFGRTFDDRREHTYPAMRRPDAYAPGSAHRPRT